MDAMNTWMVRVSGSALALVVLAVGLLAAVRAMPFAWPQAPSWIDGSLTRDFETHYKEDFPASDFGTALWTAIEFKLFGQGREGVVIGRDGWLFTEQEFRQWPRAKANLQQRLALIERVDQRLWVLGIDLIVAPVPAKARVYPDKLGERAPVLSQRLLYERLLGELQDRHVQHVDLFGALLACSHDAPSFLRTDTHWTPQGAQCAARMIAAQADRRQQLDRQSYHTEILPPQTHQGDLLRFLPMAPWFAQWMPEPDRMQALRTRAVSQAAAGDLFGDVPQPETVLVGTSYSEDQRWNFEGALAQSLGEPVLNLAEQGLGPFVPMLRYLQELEAGESVGNVRQVIWEVPERYLLTPESISPTQLPEQEPTAGSV